MKCSEIFEYLKKLYPLELAMDWDNSGFLLGRSDKEVRNVLVVLDITNEVLDYAGAKSIDLIVSHHPIIFSALKRVTDETLLGNYILKILKNDICVIAMHTNFDIAKGGMADIAEEKLSLSNTKPLEVTANIDGKELGVGKIGDLKKELSFDELLSLGDDEGGKKIIKKHPDDTLFVDIEDEDELLDIDTKEVYQYILDKIYKRN